MRKGISAAENDKVVEINKIGFIIYIISFLMDLISFHYFIRGFIIFHLTSKRVEFAKVNQ